MKENNMPHIEDVGLLILKISTMIRRRADRTVYMSEIHKVTGANGWILRYLVQHEGEAIYQKDIEENFCVTRSSVSRVLKGMEAKGFLVREGADDGRLKRLVLTEAGRQIDANAAIERKELENCICHGLTRKEIESLRRILLKIAANLQQDECQERSERI